MRLDRLAASAALCTVLLAPALAVPFKPTTPPGQAKYPPHAQPAPERRDDSRSYQRWFDAQVREYDEVDRATGLRWRDQAVLVTAADESRLTIRGRDYDARTVYFTERTKVTPIGREAARFPQLVLGKWLPKTTGTVRRLQAGDLIVVEGRLRADGALQATEIRLLGHAWGWEPAEDDYQDDARRLWGTIMEVDARRGAMRLQTEGGDRTLRVSREVLVVGGGTRHDLASLRRADRVVCYLRDDAVYRIVVLRDQERFPRAGRPHAADPDGFDPRGDGDRRGTQYDGTLLHLSISPFFYTLEIRTTNGARLTVSAVREMTATQRDGDVRALSSLRQGEALRLWVVKDEDDLFAQQVNIR